jgi:hypothetical protein
MASAALKVKVGIFMIVGVCLVVGTVIGLYVALRGEETITVVSYFEESARGVDVDAPVKFMGVTVGRVTDINIAPDFKHVEVIMTIHAAQVKRARVANTNPVKLEELPPGVKFPELLIDRIRYDRSEGLLIYVGFMTYNQRDELLALSTDSQYQEAVKRLFQMSQRGAFTARVESKGITGIKYIAIMPVPQDKIVKPQELSFKPKYPVLPSQHSTLKELTTEVRSALGKVNSALDNVNGLTGDFRALIEEGRRLSGNLSYLIMEMSNMTKTSSETVKELKQTIRQNPSSLLFSQPPEPRQDFRD